MEFDWIGLLLTTGSLAFSIWGGALMVLIPPGWQEDRQNEYVPRSYWTSRHLHEDHTGMFRGCFSSWAAGNAGCISSLRSGTWLPLAVLGLGLSMPLWTDPGAYDDSIPAWLTAITNGRFWLALLAAGLGAGLGAWIRSRRERA